MSYAEMLFEGASKQNLQLAEKLITEAGLDNTDLFPWFATFHFNPDVRTPEMSIKFVIRDSIRKKMGFGPKAEESYPVLEHMKMEIRDLHDQQVEVGDVGSLKDSEIYMDLVGKTSYPAYKWDTVRVWKLGTMESLKAQSQSLSFVASFDTGVVLFKDEVKRLDSGKTLTTFHAAGINMWLMETKEVFKVINGELIRVVASFSD